MFAQVTVVKEFEFDSAHFLPNYDGPCARMHGHTYKLQIGMTSNVKSDGFVADFSNLKQDVHEHIIKHLDHQTLNDVLYAGFPHYNPTAEHMVLWIAFICKKKISPDISFVRLYETSTSYAEWRA